MCCILVGVFSICVYCERFISESIPGSDYARLKPCTYLAEQESNNNILPKTLDKNKNKIKIFLSKVFAYYFHP